MANAHQNRPLKGALKRITYAAQIDGHQVELTFDRRPLIINTATLAVDGTEVDRARVFYGEKELRYTPESGAPIEVVVDSGMAGELTRAQARAGDAGWTDLPEQA